MQRFRTFIESFLDPENKYSWQSPLGSFHPISPLKSHEAFANEMLNKPHAMYYLFKDGWGRITNFFKKIVF